MKLSLTHSVILFTKNILVVGVLLTMKALASVNDENS